MKYLEDFGVYVTECGSFYNKKKKKLILVKPDNYQKYFRVTTARGRRSVHRLLALAFIPNPEAKPYVTHKNDIHTDNRLENLEWGTGRENQLNLTKTKGRVAKVNWNTLREPIHTFHKQGKSTPEICKLLGLTLTNSKVEYIRQIIRGYR